MRRLIWAAAMFLVTLGCIGVAIATKSVIPVFLAWLPLLALVWALNRPDPSDAAWPQPPAATDAGPATGPRADAVPGAGEPLAD